MNRFNLMIAGVFFFNVAWAAETNLPSNESSQDIARRVGQLESESKHLKEKVELLESELSKAYTEITKALSKLMPGSVVAFTTKSCPDGWREYDRAYGRFIRGIDKSGEKIDPDGIRDPGNLQNDAIKEHAHNLTNNPHQAFPMAARIPHGLQALRMEKQAVLLKAKALRLDQRMWLCSFVRNCSIGSLVQSRLCVLSLCGSTSRYT
jgi:hypothetical protein